MGARTNYFVDPTGGSDMMGNGSSGLPWASVQWALDNITRDSTNGDQINIKAGSDDTLTSALSVATYGTPSNSAPLVLRGFTSVADDRGVGGINCNEYAFLNAGTPATHVIDLRIHNPGSNLLWQGGNYCTAQSCEFDNGTGDCLYKIYLVENCHIHNFSGVGADVNHATGNYFVNGTYDFSICLDTRSTGSHFLRNIISVDGATRGISVSQDGAVLDANAILSSSGTGAGISLDFNREACMAVNNLIEGFSGTGGRGIDGNSMSEGWAVYGHNAAYNNATNYADDADVVNDLGDNESLGASPFAKSGSDTFANRATYFAAVDTGNVRGGGYPSGYNLDKGAVQSAGGSGSTTNVFIPAASGRFGVRES